MITIEHRPQVMYNLTVATAHTFFVGEGQWLVHNTCNALQNGKRVRASAFGEWAAKQADAIFRSIPDNTKGSATIAVTRIGEQLVVALNSGIDHAAVEVVERIAQRRNWKVIYKPGLGHSLEGHAERVLYSEYGDTVTSMGISNFTGPCDLPKGCQEFFKSKQIELAWTGRWKR
jgi:radical SAM superfamily enzyme YgiQ (UPF0313 family)